MNKTERISVSLVDRHLSFPEEVFTKCNCRGPCRLQPVQKLATVRINYSCDIHLSMNYILLCPISLSYCYLLAFSIILGGNNGSIVPSSL